MVFTIASTKFRSTQQSNKMLKCKYKMSALSNLLRDKFHFHLVTCSICYKSGIKMIPDSEIPVPKYFHFQLKLQWLFWSLVKVERCEGD